MSIRPADSFETESLDAYIGEVGKAGAFTVNRQVLLENTYRSEFSINILPTLIANVGDWYLIAEADQGFVRKQRVLIDGARTLVSGYEVQTRTQNVTIENTRRAGNLWVRVVAV